MVSVLLTLVVEVDDCVTEVDWTSDVVDELLTAVVEGLLLVVATGATEVL